MKNILLIAIALLGLASCSGNTSGQPDTASGNSLQLIRNATLKIRYDGQTIPLR